LGFRGLVNDRFIAALAALSLLVATPDVCAAVMASFWVATVTLSGWLAVLAARLATVLGHADLRPPGGDGIHQCLAFDDQALGSVVGVVLVKVGLVHLEAGNVQGLG
jgi:hypothetical protein